MAVKIQFRRDTAANWQNTNPILSQGELGLDTTNNRFKLGDGTTAWNDLPYTVDFQPDGTYPDLRAQATTAEDVGLENVTNESKATMFNNPTFTGTVSGVSKNHVGLGNVTNDSQVKKSATSTDGSVVVWDGTEGNAIKDGYTVSTTSVEDDSSELVTANVIKSELDAKADASLIGNLTAPLGIASLELGKIPSDQLPSFVDDVLEGYYNSDGDDLFYKDSEFTQPFYEAPNEGEVGKIYVDLNTNKSYRWSGSQYVEISESLVPNDGTLTISSGTGLSGSGTFTADQSNNSQITISADLATKEQAELGTSNTKLMTPEKTKNAIDALSSAVISQDTPPSNAKVNDLWHNTKSNAIYMYHEDDNDTKAWIDVTSDYEQELLKAPSIANLTPGENEVSFNLVNNHYTDLNLWYGFNEPPRQNSAAVNANQTSSELSISPLLPNETYTLFAQSTDFRIASSTVSQQFSTPAATSNNVTANELDKTETTYVTEITNVYNLPVTLKYSTTDGTVPLTSVNFEANETKNVYIYNLFDNTSYTLEYYAEFSNGEVTPTTSETFTTADIPEYNIGTVSYNYHSEHYSDGYGKNLGFNHDGSRFYIVSSTGRLINYVNLSTPYDLSTSSHGDEIYGFGGIDFYNVRSAEFSNSGDLFFLVDRIRDFKVFSLSTPFDLSSTLTLVQDYETLTNGPNNEDCDYNFQFSKDGYKLFAGSPIKQYSMTIPYDLSTISYDGIEVNNYALVNAGRSPNYTEKQHFDFNEEGTKVYMSAVKDYVVKEYDLDRPFDLSNLTFVRDIDFSELLGKGVNRENIDSITAFRIFKDTNEIIFGLRFGSSGSVNLISFTNTI